MYKKGQTIFILGGLTVIVIVLLIFFFSPIMSPVKTEGFCSSIPIEKCCDYDDDCIKVDFCCPNQFVSINKKDFKNSYWKTIKEKRCSGYPCLDDNVTKYLNLYSKCINHKCQLMNEMNAVIDKDYK